MSAAPHILVVDVDETVRRHIECSLVSFELRVTGAASVAAMYEALSSRVIDLIVLDLNVSGEDGWSVARELRSQSNVPIILLTGRSDDIERIIGLELGADDTLTKPINLRELVARIRAVLRRTQVRTLAPGVDSTPRALRFAGWELDLNSRRLSSPEGERIDLTRAEFELLNALLGAPQRILTRDRLLQMSHGFDDDSGFDRSVDVLVLRLRRKLESDRHHPQLIKTQRGVGYYLDAKVDTVG